MEMDRADSRKGKGTEQDKQLALRNEEPWSPAPPSRLFRAVSSLMNSGYHHVEDHAAHRITEEDADAEGPGVEMMRMSNLESEGELANPNPFRRLPDELVLRIFSYLSLQQIFQVSRTCRRFNTLTSATALWNEVALERNWPLSKEKAFYRDIVIKEVEEKRTTVKKRREQMATVIVSSRVWEWIFSVLFLYTCIATVLKFDDRIDWPWISILWPVFVYIVYLWVILAMYGHVFHKYGPFEEMKTARGECYRPLFNECCMSRCEYLSKRQCEFFLFLAAITPFFFLLLLSLFGLVPSWIVPIPLHLVTVHILLTPYYLGGKCISLRSWKLGVWYSCIVCGPLWSVFLGLLSAKLYRNASFLWLTVISPFLAMQFWAVLVSSSLIYFLRGMFKPDNKGDDMLVLWQGIMMFSGMTFGPMEVTLALAADGLRDLQILLCCIPLFFWLGVFAFTCVSCNLNVTTHCCAR